MNADLQNGTEEAQDGAAGLQGSRGDQKTAEALSNGSKQHSAGCRKNFKASTLAECGPADAV
jgi:hypothetical protein